MVLENYSQITTTTNNEGADFLVFFFLSSLYLVLSAIDAATRQLLCEWPKPCLACFEGAGSGLLWPCMPQMDKHQINQTQ